MRKINDFGKCCPVCQSLTISRTKKLCENCKAELIDIHGKVYHTSFDSEDGVFMFEIKTSKGRR